MVKEKEKRYKDISQHTNERGDIGLAVVEGKRLCLFK